MLDKKKNPYYSLMLGDATITVGAETGGNTIKVTIQLKTGRVKNPGYKAHLLAYLSTDAGGNVIAPTAPSGGVAIATNGLLIPQVAGKAFTLVSEDDGLIDINIIEAAAATWYLNLCMPDGTVKHSGAITFA